MDEKSVRGFDQRMPAYDGKEDTVGICSKSLRWKPCMPLGRSHGHDQHLQSPSWRQVRPGAKQGLVGEQSRAWSLLEIRKRFIVQGKMHSGESGSS